jgi:hypothetical protein
MKIIVLIFATCLLLVSSLLAQNPIGEVSPTSFDFGPTLVGCTSSQKRISLKNTGDAQLIMDKISISGLIALPVNHCARGVSPATHCDVYVTYSPDRVEANTGSLIFNDNASNSPQVVSLTGQGATIVPTASKMQTRSPQNIYYGQTTTFTGQVSSLGGCSIPDGELLTFRNLSGKFYCSGPIVAGLASCSAQVFAKAGPYQVNANYPGDEHFEPSTSPANVRLNVSKWPTTTTVAASPNPAHVGQPVTITATVSSAGPYAPTGVVWFIVGSQSWRVPLTNLTAQTTYTFPTAGNWSINAVYNGDEANHYGNGYLTEVVNP